MKVRTLAEAQASGRRIVASANNRESTRMLHRSDNMGFSFYSTTIYAGMNFPVHYKNHPESVYCVSGLAAEEVDA